MDGSLPFLLSGSSQRPVLDFRNNSTLTEDGHELMLDIVDAYFSTECDVEVGAGAMRVMSAVALVWPECLYGTHATTIARYYSLCNSLEEGVTVSIALTKGAYITSPSS